MDKLTVERRSQNMARIRSADTKPELAVRSMVHRMGYRYSLHRYDLPGKPDLVFAPRKKVIFVHGCFWHQHRKPSCQDSRIPKSRLDYWVPKLSRTAARDKEHLKALRQKGWKSLVLWECEMENQERLRMRLRRFLQS
jgi:DNA mismatch endonuclease (patch repair protein)